MVRQVEDRTVTCAMKSTTLVYAAGPIHRDLDRDSSGEWGLLH